MENVFERQAIFCEAVIFAPERGLPGYFQLLMKVRTINAGDEIVRVERVSHRVLRV
jgi:hypothetical protein